MSKKNKELFLIIIFVKNLMMKLYVIITFSFLFSCYSFGQQGSDTLKITYKDTLKGIDSLTVKADSTTVGDTIPQKWKLNAIYALNGSQTTFKNWNAGGRTNIALLGFISASADYKYKHLKWDTDLNLALGGIKYLEQGAINLQKSDDRIDVASNVGYNLKKHYYFSFIGGFKTQSLDGYSYPNDSVIVSTFMAPGYINTAFGFDYVPDDKFGVFLSPFAAKMTFVRDQRLANNGAFGVNKAEYDNLGNILSYGKRFRGEFGAYVKIKWNRALAKNIDMKTKLELFSNYNNKPQNIDVNSEIIINFKVNSWFSASIQWNAIYDDDILIHLANGTLGPRLQLKSVLGLGISYKLMNYIEVPGK